MKRKRYKKQKKQNFQNVLNLQTFGKKINVTLLEQNDFQVITSNLIYLGKKNFQKQIFHWINYCTNKLVIFFFHLNCCKNLSDTLINQDTRFLFN